MQFKGELYLVSFSGQRVQIGETKKRRNETEQRRNDESSDKSKQENDDTGANSFFRDVFTAVVVVAALGPY